MSMFKCKMCGGDLEVAQEMSVCECQYCGSRQTLPKLGNEKKNNLYDRAGHFRRNNEYDKAMAIYEQILSEEPEDAESYWSLVLCRYGIEYVEDPLTHKRVPTVNRAQFTSIFSDEDYKSALKYADAEQRAVYEAEARAIEQIQKGILAISNQEEAFDVFICYKESDANGRRTPDSVLANDLYHQLTQEGFRVFFARITLEDKLGSAYEPYIFAALNSAKVMVVLGTKPEYFNAVWVKNEWSRYLALIRGGAKKILIPAYKDMDPYDLPEEFSHLQAQDMSKLGFMQDLIRGIKKMAGGKDGKEEQNSTRTVADSGAEPLLKRAFMFLEDGEFEKADEFCEQALNLDPENAQAYVGKLMSELRVRKQEELGNCEEKLTENNYFQKAIRFAKDSLKKELERCNQLILDREKDSIYEVAGALLGKQGEKQFEETIEALDKAIKAYKEIGSWKDSELKLTEAVAKREELYEKVYINAKNAMELGLKKGGKTKGKLASIKEAESLLQKIEGYRDSKELEERCNTEYKNIKRKINKKRIKRAGFLLGGTVIIGAFLGIMVVPACKKAKQYNMAVEYMNEENYYPAIDMFENLDGYRDSESKTHEIKEILSDLAEKYAERGKYAEAIEIFEYLGDYGESYGECKEGLNATPADAFLYKIENGGIIIKGFAGSQITRVVIPKEIEGYPVTKIDLKAFLGCTDVTYVSLPEGITEIGDSAFRGCTGLTRIAIPDSITVIRPLAFSGCTGLAGITIPNGVTEIGASAFNGCTGLAGITIPNGVSYIRERTFKDCTGLRWITIPDSITKISDSAFSGCAGLKEIAIPDSVSSIENYAFSGCTGLTEITIPNGITEIGDSAFSGCTGLTSVLISKGVTGIIGDSAFSGCTGLTSVIIPGSITEIRPLAFSGCTGLTDVTIQKGVEEIGDYAFESCTSLEKLTILGDVSMRAAIWKCDYKNLEIYVPTDSWLGEHLCREAEIYGFKVYNKN